MFLDRNYYFRGEKPIIIPHRGGINVVPENTLHALEHTVEHNFTHFETDLRMTKDGEIILNHDATIDRTTHEKGNISELNWKDLKDGIISQGTTMPSITPFDNAPATAGTGIPTGVAPKPSNILVITLVGPRIFIPFKSAADFITFSFV